MWTASIYFCRLSPDRSRRVLAIFRASWAWFDFAHHRRIEKWATGSRFEVQRRFLIVEVWFFYSTPLPGVQRQKPQNRKIKTEWRPPSSSLQEDRKDLQFPRDLSKWILASLYSGEETSNTSTKTHLQCVFVLWSGISKLLFHKRQILPIPTQYS